MLKLKNRIKRVLPSLFPQCSTPPLAGTLRSATRLTIAIVFLFLLLTQVKADNYESERYRIQYGTINIGGENAASSGGYNLSVSLGQNAAGEFQSTGYVVKAGFQYLHSIIPFRFTISNTNMNFGTIVPQVPATQQTVLTVSFGGAGAYQVSTQEESPLKTLAATTIPNTLCNSESDPCTGTSARVWNKNDAYGFGYNMTGDDIASDFKDANYYRPFSDGSLKESPETIMSSGNVGKNRQSTVTFKVNISPIQAAGSYQTIVKFVATPGY